MRDAQSAFDQVLSFAGTTVRVGDVAGVLGLVGRDLLFEVLTAVADEDAQAAFTLTGRAVEAGHDLRILCRELAALVRAMMLVAIDPKRLADPDVVLESDRERMQAIVPRFSREDLLRSFDLLSKAEADVKAASQPRYAVEMALLKWIHLRQLVPIANLIGQLEKGGGLQAAPRAAAAAPPPRPQPQSTSLGARPPFQSRPAPAPAPRPAVPARPAPQAAPRPTTGPVPAAAPAGDAPLPSDFKERVLGEISRQNKTFFNLHVATAQKIEIEGGRLVFTFGPVHETMRQQVEARRGWLESIAESVAGRKVAVTTAKGAASDAPSPRPAASVAPPSPSPAPPDADLKAQALADGGVQAMLDVFPAEIREVEELK
jgi:DNA polymerase III gamma/tau subunit